jgi:FAD-binding domain
MSYEWFYGLHHLFIVLYAVSIAHTLDARGREKFSSRMQIVLWVAGPLVIYFVDRFMRNATIRSARVTSVKLLAPEKGSPNVNGSANRTLFLRLARPAGFTFTLGQYVRINIPEVSVEEYHPFTIGSASSAEQLELIISVVPSKEGLLNGKKTADSDGLVPTAGGVQEPNCLPGKGPGTWTERAFAYFEALSRNPEAVTYVKLEGPYGSILQSAFGLPNLALFASGSGIVPMLATLREYHGADKMSIRARAAAVPIASPGSPISPQPAGDMEHGGAAAAGGAAPPSPPQFPPALSPGFSNQSDATHSRASSTGLPSVAPSLASNASFASTIDAELKSYGFNAPEPVPQPMVVLETVLTPAPVRDEGHEHRAAIQGSNKKRVLIAKSTRFIATGPDSTSKSASSSTTSTSFVTDPLGLHVIPPPEPAAPMTGDGAIETLRVFMDVRREKTLYARAASQYPYVFAGSLLLACLQFALICLEISWYEMGVGREADLHGIDNWTWMFKGLDIVTAIAIAGFALLIIVQPYLLSEPNTTGLSSGVRKTRTGPMILPLVAAAAQAALVAYNFGNPRPTDTGGGILLVALLLLKSYQVCWHYGSNPLLLVHGAESAAAVKRGAAFTQSIQLVWSSRSASAVLALADELRGIAGDVAAACGPEALRIRAFITGPVTAAEKADLARFTKPNKPFIVSLGRPDTDELLHHMCAELAGEDVNAASSGKQDPNTTKDRPTIATGDAASTSGATAIGPVALRRDKALNVLFCGAPGLASAVRDSVLRAREAFGGKGVVLAYNSETVFG